MKTYYINPWGLSLMVHRIAEGKSTRPFDWGMAVIWLGVALAVLFIWGFPLDGLIKLLRWLK